MCVEVKQEKHTLRLHQLADREALLEKKLKEKFHVTLGLHAKQEIAANQVVSRQIQEQFGSGCLPGFAPSFSIQFLYMAVHTLES